jgi:hypothetical protein
MIDLQEPLTPDLLIRQAEALGRLLNDELVQRCMHDLKARLYREWKAAKTLEDREFTGSMVRAFDDLVFVLEGAVQSGLHEQAVIALRDKAEHQA